MRVFKADGSVKESGSIGGPASSTDDCLVVWNGNSGSLVKDSSIDKDAVVTLTGSQVLTNKTLTSPTLTTPALGTPASGVLTNCTGTVTLGTPVATTSGTAIDFTGIPASAKEITINFSGVSTNGTSRFIVQIGDSGGIETSGYLGGIFYLEDSAQAEVNYSGFSGDSFSFSSAYHANRTVNGSVTLKLMNSSANTWTCVGWLFADDTTSDYANGTVGTKSTSAVLDRVRITTAAGDTFDTGEINISYKL